MSETPVLLALGSVVRIVDDDKLYVIIARAFQKDGDEFLAGYKGVPHPQGVGAGVREVVIRHSQVVEVVHRGYEDDADVGFAKELLKNAKTPVKMKTVSVAEPDLKVALTKPGVTTASVSAPVMGVGSVVSSSLLVRDVKDPFGRLRSKGKQGK